jgi:Uma2 family endonuclease
MALSSRNEDDLPLWPRPGTRMTEERYHELEHLSPDRKYEYIDGVAYMMSGGSVAHDRIAYNMRLALDIRLTSGPCAVFGSDVQVFLALKQNLKKQFVYPDVTVSCSETDNSAENTLIASPRVVVEVLSPNTETRDRGTKFKAYQNRETVQEIVLISQFAQYVEVWQRNEQNPHNSKIWLYRHYGPSDTIDLLSIDAHIAVSELYRGLQFDETLEE